MLKRCKLSRYVLLAVFPLFFVGCALDNGPGTYNRVVVKDAPVREIDPYSNRVDYVLVPGSCVKVLNGTDDYSYIETRDKRRGFIKNDTLQNKRNNF